MLRMQLKCYIFLYNTQLLFLNECANHACNYNTNGVFCFLIETYAKTKWPLEMASPRKTCILNDATLTRYDGRIREVVAQKSERNWYLVGVQVMWFIKAIGDVWRAIRTHVERECKFDIVYVWFEVPYLLMYECTSVWTSVYY